MNADVMTDFSPCLADILGSPRGGFVVNPGRGFPDVVTVAPMRAAAQTSRWNRGAAVNIPTHNFLCGEDTGRVGVTGWSILRWCVGAF